MTDKEETPFKTRSEILGDLWVSYREEDDFKDFIEYNDIGLPAAFLISEDLATPNDRLITMVNESFDLLMAALEIKEDTGFETLEDMLVG